MTLAHQSGPSLGRPIIVLRAGFFKPTLPRTPRPEPVLALKIAVAYRTQAARIFYTPPTA